MFAALLLCVAALGVSLAASPRLRSMWFAGFWGLLADAVDTKLAEHKRELLGGVSGDVLEIGAGLGANFKFLRPEVRVLTSSVSDLILTT